MYLSLITNIDNGDPAQVMLDQRIFFQLGSPNILVGGTENNAIYEVVVQQSQDYTYSKVMDFSIVNDANGDVLVNVAQAQGLSSDMQIIATSKMFIYTIRFVQEMETLGDYAFPDNTFNSL